MTQEKIASFDDLSVDNNPLPPSPENIIIARLFVALLTSGVLSEKQRVNFFRALDESSEGKMIASDDAVPIDPMDREFMQANDDENDAGDAKDPNDSFFEDSDGKIISKERALAFINGCIDLANRYPEHTFESYYPVRKAVGDIFSLTERQSFLLALNHFASRNSVFQEIMFNTVGFSFRAHPSWMRLTEGIARKMGFGNGSIAKDYEALLSKGLLFENQYPDDDDSFFNPTSSVSETLASKDIVDRDALLNRLVGKPATVPFSVADYDYVPTFDLVPGAIREVFAGKKTGFCLLAAGKPGTMKTNALIAAANEAGVPVFVVPSSNPNNKREKIKPSAQIAHFMMMTELMPQLPGGGVIFLDDAEVAFAGESASGKETADPAAKNFFNVTFEDVRKQGLVVFMAVNDEDKIPESVRSRCTPKIDFPFPPRDRRRAFFAYHAKQAGVQITDEQADYLAATYAPEGRMIEYTMSYCASAGGDFNTYIRILENEASAYYGSVRPILAPKADAVAINWDLYSTTDLPALKAAFDAMSAPAADAAPLPSILLIGESGAGKSAFAHAAAHARGTELEIFNAVDAVRSTTPPIVALERAFVEATANKRILLVEAAEHLLPNPDRFEGQPVRSYAGDIAALMKRYRLPVIFTARVDEGAIDPAFHGRVGAAFQLDTLTDAQAAKAARGLFGLRLDAEQARSLPDGLVAGDFVAAKAALGDETGAARVMETLDILAQRRRKGLEARRGEMGFHKKIDD